MCQILFKSDCRIIELPKFLDARGNLSFAENFKHVPFEIKRTYWVYDVPGGERRGGHAYKNNDEFIIALSGAFNVTVDDGVEKRTFSLNRSYYGLYVPRGLWREMKNFSTNAFALEFGSSLYDPEDYIRDYDAFLNYRKNESPSNCSDSSFESKAKSAKGPFSVFDCSMVELDKHHSDRKGNLTVVENGIISVRI